MLLGYALFLTGTSMGGAVTLMWAVSCIRLLKLVGRVYVAVDYPAYREATWKSTVRADGGAQTC